MKQIKITSSKREDEISKLKDEIHELRKELRMHIADCPFREIHL